MINNSLNKLFVNKNDVNSKSSCISPWVYTRQLQASNLSIQAFPVEVVDVGEMAGFSQEAQMQLWPEILPNAINNFYQI